MYVPPVSVVVMIPFPIMMMSMMRVIVVNIFCMWNLVVHSCSSVNPFPAMIVMNGSTMMRNLSSWCGKVVRYPIMSIVAIKINISSFCVLYFLSMLSVPIMKNGIMSIVARR